MKKVVWTVIIVLLVALLVGGAALYLNVTAETAPVLAEESLDNLPRQVLSAMLTGQEVPITQGQLNRMIALLPAEKRAQLRGVELTGENTLVAWCKTKLWGRTCDVRMETSLSFDQETGELRCKVENVTVGNVPVSEKWVDTQLQEQLMEFDFCDGCIVIDVNELVRENLQIETAMVKNLRCDAVNAYILPASAGDLISHWLGGE